MVILSLYSERAVLVYDGTLRVKLADMRLDTDRTRCHRFECEQIQSVGLSVDSGDPKETAFRLQGAYNREMALQDDMQQWTRAMKIGKKIYMGIEAKRADADKQTASFSLMGFRDALDWIDSQQR